MKGGPEGSGGRLDRQTQPISVETTAAAFRRTSLGHTPPAWVTTGALYFITVCAANRGTNVLCVRELADRLLETVENYHARHRWFVRLFLIMPDHVHGLISFPAEERMTEVIRNWKSFTARTYGIEWQRNFFDHRLRSDESWEEKAHYIRMNPERAGLISMGEQWPHVLEHAI